MAVFPPHYNYSSHADGQNADAADLNVPAGGITDTVNEIIDGCNTLNTQVQDHETAIDALIPVDKMNLVVEMNPIRPDEVVDITATMLGVPGPGGAWASLAAVNVSPDILVLGVNGLDVGAVAPDVSYTVWVIYNPNTTDVAGLFSLSPAAPTLPAGYTYSRRVGVVLTDGVSDIHPFVKCAGSSLYRLYPSDVVGAEPGITNIAGFVNNVWTDVDWSGILPAFITSVVVAGYFHLGGVAAFSSVSIRPNGSAADQNLATRLTWLSTANQSDVNEKPVSLDASGIFEAVITDNAVSQAVLALAGWYDDI